MGTHLTVLSESFPMNTNMTGFRWFSKIFAICPLDESSFSIGRVNCALLSLTHSFPNVTFGIKFIAAGRIGTYNALCFGSSACFVIVKHKQLV